MMLMQEIPWLVIIILLPLLTAVACFVIPRHAKFPGVLTAVAIVVSVAGLGWQIKMQGVINYAVGGWGSPLGINLYADGLSLLMLAMTALVGLAISVYSMAYFNAEKAVHFWPIWMLLWTALNALFLTADIFNLYVTLELLGLSAVALVALAGSGNALAGAMRYLLVSLLGSLCYLLGVALLYHSFATVDTVLLAQRIESTPAVWAAMGLMTAGLLLKTALFPLHFWLPPTHASAPAPVSALLSALVVKASFYILLRLWLDVFPTDSILLPQFLGLLGAAAILWGGIHALRQTQLKMMIAYSTVSQLGYLFLVFPLGIDIAWKGAMYLLISHALAKSAMFMAAGNILLFGGHDRIIDLNQVAHRLPLTLAAFAMAGVSIIGLPPSGGFVGKWLLLEASLGTGKWWWAGVMILGSLLAAAYVFKVVSHAFAHEKVTRISTDVPKLMEWTVFVLALSVILLGFIAPWILPLMDIGLPFNMGEQR